MSITVRKLKRNFMVLIQKCPNFVKGISVWLSSAKCSKQARNNNCKYGEKH